MVAYCETRKQNIREDKHFQNGLIDEDIKDKKQVIINKQAEIQQKLNEMDDLVKIYFEEA